MGGSNSFCCVSTRCTPNYTQIPPPLPLTIPYSFILYTSQSRAPCLDDFPLWRQKIQPRNSGASRKPTTTTAPSCCCCSSPLMQAQQRVGRHAMTKAEPFSNIPKPSASIPCLLSSLHCLWPPICLERGGVASHQP